MARKWKFGRKVIANGMGQSQRVSAEVADSEITNA